MQLRRTIGRALAALLAMMCFGGVEPAKAETSRPNIVFVLFDDLGWAQPQCYDPRSALRTPNLDELAVQGMRFTDAHSAAAVCTPTRYGVLTGRYPSRIGQFGVLSTWSPPIVPTSRTTVASLLKQQGYDTACVGKWHLGLNWEKQSKAPPAVGTRFTDGPNQLGFDYFCGFTHAGNIGCVLEQDRVVAHVTQEENQPLMLRKAVEWIENRNRDRPFFLYFPMCPPHYPVAPAPEFLGKSGGVDLAGKGLKGQADPEHYPDWLFQGDAMLGEIMRVLDRRGLAENTLLIATSDNGAEQRSYAPLRESKRSIYEGGHRVLFVARWPGKIKAGSTWDHTVCLNDLMATAAEITGAKLPANAGEDSVSLLPALLGKSDAPTREGTIHQSMSGDLALRQGPWKMIFKKDGSRELYNLDADLSEANNVLAAHTDVAAQLTALMQRYIAEGRSTPGAAQQNDFHLGLDGGLKDRQTHEKKSKVRTKERQEKLKRLPAEADSGRDARSIAGWTLYVSRQLQAQQPEAAARAIELLEKQLQEIVRVVPPAAVAEMRKVPLYFSPEYANVPPRAEYHPNEGWLRRNGRDPAMAKGIEFTNIRIFEQETNRMPNFALHELAHAYHDRVLPQAFDNPDIKFAYEKAKASGKFDTVERWHGNGRPNTFERAYAMTSPQEYFAETSEALFSRNDFFPFTRGELKRHDYEMFRLLEQLWNCSGTEHED
ncbi:MAG: sulfatase-like hydrolase/transferase [Aureliella sp.]